jgi:hypothetical protein
MNLGNNVLPIDFNGGFPWSAQGDVQNSAIFGNVDPITPKHRVDPPTQTGLVSQLNEERECFCCNSIFRVIEVNANRLRGQALTTLRVIREQVTEM